MSTVASKIERQETLHLSGKPDKWGDVLQLDSTRRRIGIIADRTYALNLLDESAYSEYKKLAEGREDFPIPPDMMEKIYEDADKYEKIASRIDIKVRQAINNGHGSEEIDWEHLVLEGVVNNLSFIKEAERVEGIIDGKLQRLARERKRYDVIYEKFGDVGHIKLGPGKKIDIPDLETFLEGMDVKKRREFLEKAEAAIPQAEAYAAEIEASTSEKDLKDYETMLNGAMNEEKIIGIHTKKAFMDGFRKLDAEDRQEWLAGFKDEMSRYRDLWNDIRQTFPANSPTRNKIEGFRHNDAYGYTEIFVEFGALQKTESSRLCNRYSEALEGYRLKPGEIPGTKALIGEHTIGAFNEWMENDLTLPEQYSAEQKLEGEMFKYRRLWQEAKKLPSKQLNYMISMVDEWGYTELNDQLKTFQSGGGVIGNAERKRKNILSGVDNKSIQTAIEQTDEMLSEGGPSKKIRFVSAVKRIISGKTRSQFDAETFQQGVLRRAQEEKWGQKNAKETSGLDQQEVEVNSALPLHTKPYTPPEEQKEEGQMSHPDEQLYEEDDTEELIDAIEDEEEVSVLEYGGLTEVQIQDDDDDETDRITRLGINDYESTMDRFLSEDASHNYNNLDEVEFTAYDASSQENVMSLGDIQSMVDYMEVGESATNDKPEELNT